MEKRKVREEGARENEGKEEDNKKKKSRTSKSKKEITRTSTGNRIIEGEEVEDFDL